MAAPEEINADMLAFWNGKGGDIWVARQEHTDITLAPVTNALLVFAAPRAGERVVDIGCGCGAPTLEFARAAGPSGRVAGLDISGPMLAEGERRASAAGIANVDWRQADPATAALDEYDLLVSAFGVMFFGDRVAAFTNMRRAAAPDARMALVCWRSLAENPWMEVPMTAAAQHLPPRPKPVPNAPGMFAFADRDHVTESPRPVGRRRASRNSTWTSISPPAGGWRRLWFSQPKSAPRTVGCATSQQRSSRPPSPLFTRRLRPMRTVRECDCPARCG